MEDIRSNKTSGRQLKIAGISFDLKLTIIVLSLAFLPIIRMYSHIGLRLYETFPSISILRNGSIQYVFDISISYLLIPLLVIMFMFRENPLNYGLQLGNWKKGLIWTVVYFILVILVKFFFNSADNQIPDLLHKQFLSMIAILLIALFAWEFFTRGFMLFGLAEKIGPGAAILMQMLLFTVLHLGKSQVELLFCPVWGLIFGITSWRTKSILYPILMHAFTAILFFRA